MKSLLLIPCITLCFFLLPTEGNTQTKPQQSLYLLNYNLLNPAATGIDNFSQVQGGIRKQWVGVDGAPSTVWFNGSFVLGKRTSSNNGIDSRPSLMEKGQGLGITTYQETIGPYSILNLNIGYAYHLPVAQGWALSMGFAGGMQQMRYDISKAVFTDQPIDPVFNTAGTLKKVSPDLNAGLMLYNKNSFIGVSVLQILPPKTINNPNGQTKYKSQFVSSAGYSFDVSDNGMRCWLSGVIKTDLSNPLRYDINAKMSYRDLFWFGGSYRKNDAVSALAGINITPSLGFAYMYDYGIFSRMDVYSRGSHEFTIGYRFLKNGQSISPKISW